MSSYMIFNKQRMTDIHAASPAVPFVEISKMVALEWKNLSEDKKKKYTKKEEEAKKQYVLALAEYNTKKQKSNENGTAVVAEKAGKNDEKAVVAVASKTKAEKKAEKIARKLLEKTK